MRADIHTLYDLNLIGVDNNGKVWIAQSLKETEYQIYQDQIIIENIPVEMSANLAKRFELFLKGREFN